MEKSCIGVIVLNRLTELTKRDIYELFRDGYVEEDLFLAQRVEYPYYGRMDEIEFLERIYDLGSMASYDSRYSNAKDDIIQHTVANDDYEYCWVFHDDRFGLEKGTDEIFLRFLCEIFSPIVRDEKKQWEQFLARINELIRNDGYELYVCGYISGREKYGYRIYGVDVADKMDKNAIRDLIDEFKSGLIAKATNGDMSEKDYKRCRDILMQVPELKSHIPTFIKSNHSANDFRSYMQAYNQHYADRRSLIHEEMDELASYLDKDSDPFMQMKEYEKQEELGSGGFGTVHKYHNNCLDMDFAVKVYEPVFVSPEEQSEGEKRFFREAKMLFSLNNTHIARIYDAGRMEGKPYIRMEYIKGYTIEELREREGNMSFSRSAIVITHILAGLKHAHEHGVMHRDLRPRNVIFSEQERMFKIIDFGVSAFLDTENHTQLTKTGEHIAGGAFIDPMLQENPRLRDVRSDIYSVGAIWYYLLCGRAPGGSDMREYLENSNSELTKSDIDIIMKCLSSNIDNRYSSCDELLPIVKNAAISKT